MHILMKKSTEPSRDEMNKTSTEGNKAEYYEKLRKENQVCLPTYGTAQRQRHVRVHFTRK